MVLWLCYINSDSYLRLYVMLSTYLFYLIHKYALHICTCRWNRFFLGFFIFGVVLWKVAKEFLSHLQATMDWTCIFWPHWSGFPSDVCSSPCVHSLMQVRFCFIIFLFKGILQVAFFGQSCEAVCSLISGPSVTHHCLSLNGVVEFRNLTLERIR